MLVTMAPPPNVATHAQLHPFTSSDASVVGLATEASETTVDVDVDVDVDADEVDANEGDACWARGGPIGLSFKW